MSAHIRRRDEASGGARFPHLMIQASAGTGKTHHLVGRYLRLLDAFEKPEEIVALTFTRKAAAEFFDRILGALAKAAATEHACEKICQEYQLEIDQARALSLLRLCVDRLHLLSLGTLDSFCGRVLRAFPGEFGISADFRILEDSQALRRREEILETVLSNGGDDPGFLEAFRRATFGDEEMTLLHRLDGFVGGFHELYLSRPEGTAWGGIEKIWPEGGWWLQAEARSGHREACEQIRRWGAGLGNGHAVNGATSFADYVEPFVPGSTVGGKGLPKLVEQVLEKADALAKGEVEELKIHRGTYPLPIEVQRAFATAAAWLRWCLVEPPLQHTRGIHGLLQRFEGAYDSGVRQAGWLGFNDVLLLLNGRVPVIESDTEGKDRGLPRWCLSMGVGSSVWDDSLSREARRLDVDYRLDQRYRHWLLDEFQDTSREQWQVLANLIDEVIGDDSGERSFYYVGDTKQSIYGWRGGDARLFREVHDQYVDRPEAHRIGTGVLQDSYRSGPALLDSVNQLFGDAARLKSALDRDHHPVIDERWMPAWSEHRSQVEDRPGYVRWCTVPQEGNRSTNAERFAVILECLREVDPVRRGLSCAVLVRRGSVAHELTDFLRRSDDLPVMVEGSMPIGSDHPVATSFRALLQWAAHPGDRLAREHLAMTPVFRREPRESARAAALEAWGESVLRLIHDQGFEAAFEVWATALRTAVGGLDAFAERRIAQIAETCRQADLAGQRNPDAFQATLNGAVAGDAAGPGVVQVMTIHKAKGLTFDVVLVADLEGRRITELKELAALLGEGREGQQTGPPEWILQAPRKELAQSLSPLDQSRLNAEREAAFGELCALYVALTRARFANYVVTSSPPKSGGGSVRCLLQAGWGRAEDEEHAEHSDSPFPADAIERLPEGWEVRFETGIRDWYVAREAGAAQASEAERKGSAESGGEVLGRRRFPLRRRRLPSQGDDWAESVSGPSPYDPSGREAADFGTAVHALFERLEWLSGDEAPDWEAWAETDVPPPLRARALSEVKGCLSHEGVQRLFREAAYASPEVWRERRFEMILEDEEWVSGVFDRVVLEHDDQGRCCRASILDFKTNHIDGPERLESLVAHYRPQLEVYRQALARLVGLEESSIGGWLIFTGPGKVFEVLSSGAD